MRVLSADSDEMTGGDDNDTFVFGPGHGNDIINDFTTDNAADNDRIDLSAFELEADDLVGMISVRGTGANAYVQIDLTSVDGGTIELAGVTDLDDLEATGGTTADEIDTLSVFDAEAGTGIFIL